MDHAEAFHAAMKQASADDVDEEEFSTQMGELAGLTASALEAVLARHEVEDPTGRLAAVVATIRIQQKAGCSMGAFLTALAFATIITEESICFLTALAPWLRAHAGILSNFMDAMKEKVKG